MSNNQYLLSKLDNVWEEVRPTVEPYFYAILSLLPEIDLTDCEVTHKSGKQILIGLDWRRDNNDWSLSLLIFNDQVYGEVYLDYHVHQCIDGIKPWQLPDVMGFPHFSPNRS